MGKCHNFLFAIVIIVMETETVRQLQNLLRNVPLTVSILFHINCSTCLHVTKICFVVNKRL